MRAWAAKLLKQVVELFTYWHQFRSGGIQRRELGWRMEPVQEQMHALLEQGQQLPLPKAVRFSNELPERWRALWAFIYVDG